MGLALSKCFTHMNPVMSPPNSVSCVPLTSLLDEETEVQRGWEELVASMSENHVLSPKAQPGFFFWLC